ncbi:MAG TPA: hypothetical protein VFK68_01400 [Propionibacteriaceae bacterium]|nr:hypothetical protein [Propionibacteriaceae bacterium]
MSDVLLVSQAAPHGVAWPHDDLEERVVRALGLAATVLDELGETGFTDAERPALGFGPDKPVAESAMLAYAAAGATASRRLATAVDEVVERLVPLCRSPRALADAALRPSRAFKYAIPHTLLTALGHPDERVDDFFLGQCADARGLAADLPPVARMERQWVMGRYGPSGFDVRGTALERPLDVLAVEREDAYALTHALFYVSDFARHAPATLGRPRASLLDDVRALVARYLRLEDYDLCGELLMAWPELGAGWDPVSSFAFRVLAEVEDRVGLLPCGNVDERRVAAMDGPEARRYTLATAYHTAFVMGFACAAALRVGPPARRLDRVMPPDPVWADLYGLVDHGRGHWQGVFATLDDDERAALTPMLADMAALDAMESRDYRRADRVLDIAAWVGIEGPLQRRSRAVLAALGRAVELTRS